MVLFVQEGGDTTLTLFISVATDYCFFLRNVTDYCYNSIYLFAYKLISVKKL